MANPRDAAKAGANGRKNKDEGGVMNYMGFDGRAQSAPARKGKAVSGKFDVEADALETQWLSLDEARYGLTASAASASAASATAHARAHEESDGAGADAAAAARGSSSRIAGLVLSLWDNLSGPRVEHAWCARHVARSTLQQTAPYTLNGEMLDAALDADTAAAAGSEHAARLEHKLLLLEQHGVVCVLFCARHRGALARFSLSLVLERAVLARYTALAPILHDRLTQLVELYRRVALLELPASAVLHVLDALVVRLMPPLHALLDARTLCAPVPFHRTLFAHAALSATQKALLARALTALLQSGALVVLGGDAAQIAAWLCTLAQFLSPTQRHVACVRVQSGAGVRAYVPDLALQGLLCARDAAVLEAEALVQGVCPVSVLDLHALRVLAAQPRHQYAVVRHDYLEHVRRRLLRATHVHAHAQVQTPLSAAAVAPVSSSAISSAHGGSSSRVQHAYSASGGGGAGALRDTWTTDPLLHALDAPAPLCVALVERIAALPLVPLYLRQAACAHAHAALLQRAHVLVSYAEALFEAAYALQARSAVAAAATAPAVDEFTVGLVERSAATSVATAGAPAPGGRVSARARTTELRSPAVASVAQAQVHTTRVPRQITRLAQLHAQHLQQHTPPLQPQTGSTSNAAHTAGAVATPPAHEERATAALLAGVLDPRETRRRLRHALGLSEADLLVLLGLAEALQRGTYVAVAGNPAWIEEKLIEFFEHF